jgi:hypothetical protein
MFALRAVFIQYKERKLQQKGGSDVLTLLIDPKIEAWRRVLREVRYPKPMQKERM